MIQQKQAKPLDPPKILANFSKLFRRETEKQGQVLFCV